jgi:outer membrane protein TolC
VFEKLMSRFIKAKRSIVLLLFLLLPLSAVMAQDARTERASREGVARIQAELKRLRKTRRRWVPKAKLLKLPNIPTQSPVLRPRRKVLPLTLNDAIRLALRNDLSSKISLLNAQARGTSVDTNKANFDPNFEASIFRSRNRRTNIFQNPLTGLPANAVTNQNDRLSLATSISKLFSFGGTGSLSWNQTRSETVGASNNPQVDVGVSVSFTQPLLKGRGFEVTLASLNNSRLDRADAYARFGQSLQQMILDVRQSYWAVVSAEENLGVQKANLSSAYEFLKGEETKVKEGAGKTIDVTLAQATVARRMESVIRAETQIENSRDALLNRISPSADLLAWDVFLVPLDRPTYIDPPSFDLKVAMDTAFEKRLDIQIANRALERERRNLAVAQNNSLPSLDLQVSGGVATTQRKHHNAYSALDPPEESFNIRAGLTLKFPLYFRAERANAARARYTLRSTELDLAKRRSDAILEIRRSIRNIISARERVLVNQESLSASETQLAQQKASLNLGASIARNLLDAQQRRADARLSLQQSLIDYRESIAGYQGSIGLLLDFYRRDFTLEIQDAIDQALPSRQRN